ncbi:MAG TPA: tetratricopeptide repeat protein [Bacteroidota bacterium]|nr:tetratricopeptide repeat protein [Bacteroidota bacterium]
MKRILFITILGLFIGSLAWSQQSQVDHAKELLKNNNPQEAISILKPLLTASPKDETLWLLLAQSYLKTGNLDSAQLAAQKTVELEDDMSEAYLVLSQIQLAKQNMSDAYKTAKKGLSLKKKQDYEPLWLQLGKTLIAMDSADASLIAFSKARELDAADVDSYAGIGDSYLKLSQPVYPMAIDQYEKALQIDSTRADIFYRLATVYAKDRQYTEAAKIYAHLISMQPDNNAARVDLARLYFRAKQFGKCAATLKEYFDKEKNPSKETLQMYLEALYNVNRFKDALPVAQQYIKVDPNSGIALRVIAQNFIDDKQYGQAVDTYMKIASVDTMEYDDFRKLGICYGLMKKDSLSAVTFEKALSLDSTQYLIWGEAGNRWMTIHQWERAAKCYEKRVALDTTVGVITAYFNYAQCLMQLNQYDAAEDALKKAIEKNPKFPLSYVQMGFCLVQEKKINESRPWFEKTIKIIDTATTRYRLELFDSYRLIALSYMLEKKDEEHPLKRWEDALINLEKAIKIKEDDADTQVRMGQCYQNLNKKEEALKHYKRALQLDPKNKEAKAGIAALSQ